MWLTGRRLLLFGMIDILIGMSLFVALHWSENGLSIILEGILVISNNAYKCSWFSKIFSYDSKIVLKSADW